MIPALDALTDALLAFQDAYAQNDADWDTLIAHDPSLMTDFYDLLDDTNVILWRLVRVKEKAEALEATERICKMLDD